MTLREISNWAAGIYNAFSRDLGIVFSVSPMDWPIYMLALVVIVSMIALSLVGTVISIVFDAWESHWKVNFDESGNATTFIGKFSELAWFTAFLICMFALIWTFVGVVTAALVTNMFTSSETADYPLLFVIIVPTICALGFVVIAVGKQSWREKIKSGLKSSSYKSSD